MDDFETKALKLVNSGLAQRDKKIDDEHLIEDDEPVAARYDCAMTSGITLNLLPSRITTNLTEEDDSRSIKSRCGKFSRSQAGSRHSKKRMTNLGLNSKMINSSRTS